MGGIPTAAINGSGGRLWQTYFQHGRAPGRLSGTLWKQPKVLLFYSRILCRLQRETQGVLQKLCPRLSNTARSLAGRVHEAPHCGRRLAEPRGRSVTGAGLSLLTTQQASKPRGRVVREGKRLHSETQQIKMTAFHPKEPNGLAQTQASLMLGQGDANQCSHSAKPCGGSSKS